MGFPTFVEKYGSLSASGFAKEATFGTPVAATTFLPMTGNTMEEDPGWFSPELMQDARDLHQYNMYGEAKFTGAVDGPLFPSNAMALTAASVGQDNQIGWGIWGTLGGTPTNTTLSGSAAVGATSITLASGTGFATGQEVIVDSGYLAEARKISNVVGAVLTLADGLVFAHASGVTVSTQVTTTTSGSLSIGATSVTLTSAAAFTANTTWIQIDVNSPTGSTTSEVRKVTNVVTNTVTLDQGLTYAHGSGVQALLVTSLYAHIFSQTNTLPSLTVEKNIGNFQSLQFAGCRVAKYSLKAPVGNVPIELTADLSGQSVTSLNSPTAVSVTNEIPYVFAEATLNVFGSARTDTENVQLDIDNGLKETWTYSGQHGPSFITPVTVHAMGTIDVVFDSLTDSTYGDFNRMANGTLGSLALSFTHPASGGIVVYNLPQIVLSKYANDLKMTEVVRSSLTYEATRGGSATPWTVQATVFNTVYLPY